MHINSSVARMVAAAIATAAVCATIACGSNSSTQTESTTPVPRPAATTAMQAETNALPMAQAQPVPKTLKCTDEIVWVNMKRKTIHEPGDPYYGKTKNGQYMCKADAIAAGDHMAGARHKSKHANEMAPAPTKT